MPLREIVPTRQVKGEEKRKWFSSPEMDLIVWVDESGEITGFQICYGKERDEKALTWKVGKGLFHAMIDDGEGKGELGRKASPILTANVDGDAAAIASLFQSEAANLAVGLQRFVLSRLREYAAPAP